MPGDFKRETLEMRVLNQNVEIKRLKAEIERLREDKVMIAANMQATINVLKQNLAWWNDECQQEWHDG